MLILRWRLMSGGVVLAIIALGLVAHLNGQTTAASGARATSASSQPQDAPLANSDDALRREVEAAKTQLNFLQNLLVIGGTFLGIILGIGAGSSLYSMYKFEGRTRESHNLVIRGETASQARAAAVHENFLEASMTTLQLVNETLSLAKEASERAARAQEDRVQVMLEGYDKEARALLLPNDDDRHLVRHEHDRARLRSLAQKLSGFEVIILTLPRQIGLTAHCLFIRGMEYHLGQQFDEAIACWEKVGLDEKANPYLRSLAWYWIGYERNNLEDFPGAIVSFEQALGLAEGPRTTELQRILIESKFFDEKRHRPESVASEFEALLSSPEFSGKSDQILARRWRVAGTYGNVLHVIGDQHRLKGELQQAAKFYDRAIDQFEDAAKSGDKWARFGWAEALYRGGRIDESLKLYRDRIRNDAIEEEISRVEPRTKALARQTQLIACIRVPEWNATVPELHRAVNESIGYVNERSTVYSQLQRRNVSRSQLKQDLLSMVSELGNRAEGGVL